MIISQSGSVVRLLAWQWRAITLSFSLATLVTIAYENLGWTWLALPTLPLVIVGAALGIFVSFRTNSCYDRWWEARKLWGRLINTSRHLAIEVIHYLPANESARARSIVVRHIAYVHGLRCLLRQQDPFGDDDVTRYLTDEERGALPGTSNLTARLLDLQMGEFVTLNEQNTVDAFRLQSLDESIRHLLDIQGGCERIKKTPLPRAYGFISERMIQWFGAILPCALVAELGWATIPVSVLVMLCFKLISETGRVLDDPFNTYWNALPLSDMSRTIEINLLELLGDTDLPDPIQPNPPHVLM